MKRDLVELGAHEHDLVVVGGGVFGVAVARDAALRGLDVALLEKADFAGATSSNSFRMVHGGIRYLQHADLRRLRASSLERNILLRTAPHLVHPLPILIPTYGRGVQGKAFLRAGMLVYDGLTWDRNRDISDPERKIPPSTALSRDDVLERFPGIPEEGLTGGCVFADAQMHHPARLVVAMLRSAVEAGARVANYVEVKKFVRADATRVVGVRARDVMSGDEFTVRGRWVVNAAGAWAEPLLREGLGLERATRSTFSRDLCLVIGRRPSHDWGLAVLSDTRDPDAVVSRSRRHLFVVPWRGRTLVGVWHTVYDRPPDQVEVDEREVRAYLAEINRNHSGLDLTVDDVELCNAGLVLFGENAPGSEDLSYGKRSRTVDHEEVDGISGLLTLIGVRFTTARADAESVVDTIVARLGKGSPCGETGDCPVFGGDFSSISSLTREVGTALPVDPEKRQSRRGVAESLARNYGSQYRRVLDYGSDRPDLLRPLSDSTVLGAEIVHGIREEMARTLEDVVFRRTDLGITGAPTKEALEQASTVAADELGWTEAHRRAEVESVQAQYPLAPPLRPARGEREGSGVSGAAREPSGFLETRDQ